MNFRLGPFEILEAPWSLLRSCSILSLNLALLTEWFRGTRPPSSGASGMTSVRTSHLEVGCQIAITGHPVTSRIHPCTTFCLGHRVNSWHGIGVTRLPFIISSPRRRNGSTNQNTHHAEFGAPLTNPDSAQSYKVPRTQPLVLEMFNVGKFSFTLSLSDTKVGKPHTKAPL